MKSFVVVVMLVLSLGIVAAHDVGYKDRFVETKYYSGDSVVVSKTVWVKYENEKRYSTYEYRHGYSYRATRDYSARNSVPSKLGTKVPFSSGKDKYERVIDLAHDYTPSKLRTGVSYSTSRRVIDLRVYENDYSRVHRVDSGVMGYRYKYVPHLRSYEKRDCYVTPPADRLFYIAC